MARYDASSAECLVFTYKEGLMSAAAHDLKLKISSWSMNVDVAAGTLEATFEAGSIRYVTAMKDGRDNPSAFGIDARRIEKSINKDVLKTRKHPRIQFTATELRADGEGFSVAGRLTLNGVTRTISAVITRTGGRLEATVRLHQPDFGIKPFSALLGALKIKPAVDVRISVPAP